MTTIIILTLVLVILMIISIYYLGQMDILFTTAPSGEIRFISVNEKFEWGFVNHHDYGFLLCNKGACQNTGLGNLGKLQSFLFKTLGVVWIGFFRSVHEFKIDADKLTDQVEQAKTTGTTVRKMIVHTEKTVKGLWVKIPRPVLVKDVELADGSRVDFVLILELRVLNGYKAVFTYRNGNVLPLVDRALRGAVNDYFSENTVGTPPTTPPKSYVDLIDKTTLSHGSPFVTYLDKKMREDFEIDPINNPEGKYGLIIESIGTEAYSLAPEQEELEKARLEIQKAQSGAKAAITVAEGKRQATILEGEGLAESAFLIRSAQADGDKQRHDALTSGGTNPDIAASVIAQIDRAKSIGEGKTSLVYSEGNSNNPLGVIVNQSTPPTP